jgi:hypothetical protein
VQLVVQVLQDRKVQQVLVQQVLKDQTVQQVQSVLLVLKVPVV